GGIRHIRVPVSQSVKSLRPGSLQFVADTQVQGQLVGGVKSIVHKQRAVGLFARSQSRDFSHARGLVSNRLAFALPQSQQQIGDGLTGTRCRVFRIVLRKGAVETKEAARNIRLRVVVEAFLQLTAKLNGMAPAN